MYEYCDVLVSFDKMFVTWRPIFVRPATCTRSVWFSKLCGSLQLLATVSAATVVATVSAVASVCIR